MSVEKSRAEIERILKRYGASHFAFMSSPDRATIAFRASDRNIRFDLPLPAREKFVRPPFNRRHRSPAQIDAHWDQACRERWRALVLCIWAKLESVESRIETFETAFMAHIVMPDGKTAGEHVLPRIAAIYSGSSVPLFPTPSQS